MSQVMQSGADVQTGVDEYDAIRRTVQLCLDGEARGASTSCARPSTRDARMFGSLAGERYDAPITKLFDLAASAPADTGRYRSRILAVQQTGDAAFATVGGGGERSRSSTTCPSRRSTGRGGSSAN